MVKNLRTLLVATTLLTVSALAQAENPGMHHARTKILLDYAQGELKMLALASNTRHFDLDLVEKVSAQLKATLSEAKRSCDRSSSLLDDKRKKARTRLEKLRGELVQAEAELVKFDTMLKEQVKPFFDQGEEEETPLELEIAEKPPVSEPDWAALKRRAGWLSHDVANAQKAAARVSKRLKMPRMRLPPKPRGDR